MNYVSKQIVRGTATYIPGLRRRFGKGTGGTISARYCYSVWLRHLTLADANGLNSNPSVIAELGPGDSLGIGLAALLSGSEKYYAFDVVEFASAERNLEVFDELVELFSNRASIPGPDEFPEIKPQISDYSFPTHLLSDERLHAALSRDRLDRIRNSIAEIQNPDSMIQYKVPWFDERVVTKGGVDMIYSQAVLEHVDDLDGSYESMQTWLSPRGFISHQIDLRCHGTAEEWNGHWAYSDFVWKLIKGNRAHFLNRIPRSQQIRSIENAGFEIVFEKSVDSPSTLISAELPSMFKGMSQKDLTTSGVFIQAVKASG